MLINNIDFWQPIVFDEASHSNEKASNFVENFLWFGGKKIHVMDNNFSIEDERISQREYALKVVCCIITLGIFPLILLITKAICRSLLERKISQLMDVPNGERELEQLQNLGQKLLTQGKIFSGNAVKVKVFNRRKFIISLNDRQVLKIQEVVRSLGRGGFGKVSEILDLQTKERTAFKVATPHKHKNIYNPAELKSAERDLIAEVTNLQELNPHGTVVGIQMPPRTNV